VNNLSTTLTGGDNRGYVGFLADEGGDRVRAAYPGTTWDRLRDVKAKYDPDNLFRRNQNIPPAE
jgi:FAD/FMN-containing dehydrogenase